jgi:hypothetical protein
MAVFSAGLIKRYNPEQGFATFLAKFYQYSCQITNDPGRMPAP